MRILILTGIPSRLLFKRRYSERIKSKKEEEFQHDFLEFIFDNCLGYNIKDSADQNLFKEVKNVTDSKKADGAIKQGEDIVAVIELKSTKTKDFNEIQKQAFGYKNNHPNCRYVVSSNFQKLRFILMMQQSLKSLIYLN